MPISTICRTVPAGVLQAMLLAFLYACGGGGGADETAGPPPIQTVPTPVQTSDGWETASLAEAGIEAAPIIDAVNEIRRGTYNEIHGFILVKDGKLVLEEYGSGRMYSPDSPDNFTPVIEFDRDELHILHSVSKSLMSTLAGIAIREGYLTGENESTLGFFPEHFDPSQAEKNGILLKHLMTMTAGLEWNEWDVPAMDFENNDAMRYQRAADPSAYFFGKTLLHEPGTVFYYNTAGFQMMGEVIRRVTAMGLDQFADQQMFAPMGITDFDWQQYEHGPVYIVGDILLKPRDMAKFGQLLLRQGQWNGRQIVPPEWLDKATAQFISVAHTGYKGFEGYGFYWWLKTFRVAGGSFEAICADGLAGQAIMAFPSLDVVVVITGGNYSQPDFGHELVTNHVLPAVIG